jgi:hypothetical protein
VPDNVKRQKTSIRLLAFSKVFAKYSLIMLKILEIGKYFVNDRYASLSQKVAKVGGIQLEVNANLEKISHNQ